MTEMPPKSPRDILTPSAEAFDRGFDRLKEAAGDIIKNLKAAVTPSAAGGAPSSKEATLPPKEVASAPHRDR